MPGLAYSRGEDTTPLLRETIGRNLESMVARFPDRDALVSVHQGIRQSYRAFDHSVDLLAMGLLRLGLEVGDRVGIWSPNCAEWVWLQYATAKVGAILVNINPAYRTHELPLRTGAVGMPGTGLGTEVPLLRLPGDGLRGRGRSGRPGAGDLPRHPRVGLPSWSRRRTGWTRSAWRAGPPPCTTTTPSTSSTRQVPPGSPRAPRSATPTS